MSDVIGWIAVGVIVALPVIFIGYTLWWAFSRAPLEQRYGDGGLGGGAFNGIEAVFSPSAHEADAERDRQTKRTAPAPTPGDPPWTIDGDHIRISV